MKSKIYNLLAIISLILAFVFAIKAAIEANHGNLYEGFNAFDYLQCAFAGIGFSLAFRHFQKRLQK